MSYNNKYNTRHSGRFNTPGQFVPAAELAGGAAPGAQRQHNNPNLAVGQPFQQQQYSQPPLPPPPAPPRALPANQNTQQQKPQQHQQQQNMDVEMKQEIDGSSEGPSRPPWMKSKLTGVKKISNKERRRRQNEHLRRLLTPKNALMVLNEMMPNEQVNNQFKVEPASNQFYNTPNTQSFCADLNLDGNVYKGYGENKMTARNAAAEKAVRDMIIKRMAKVFAQEAKDGKEENGGGGGGGEEEALPMIQLASFALHKLFSEWEYEGVKVPQLKAHNTNSTSEPLLESPPPPKPKPPMRRTELPKNAASLHPCMLLTYMRPGLEYRELAVTGDRPQAMLFTMGVDVDGATYIGKAPNKKEARRAAARAACAALFGVQTSDAPIAAAAPQP